MASALLSAETTVLTSAGWITIGQLRSGEICGADRHGTVVSSPVSIDAVPSGARRAVVGTEAAVGLFVGETVLVSRDGVPVSVNDLISDVTGPDVWFENFTKINVERKSEPTISRFRESLRVCAVELAGAHVIRSRGRGKKAGQAHAEIGTIVDHEGTRLAVLNHSKEPTRAPWSHFVLDAIETLWKDPDDDFAYEIDGPESAICLWHVSALRAKGSHFKLQFDSMQHSLFARVAETEDRYDSPIHRCRTAFYSVKPCTAVRLRWDARLWRPIVSGFLVPGN